MGTLFYVMAVFGCADGAIECTEARLADRRFESQAQCERAVEDVLMASSDVGAPTIAARCMSSARYVSAQPNKRQATLKLAALAR